MNKKLSIIKEIFMNPIRIAFFDAKSYDEESFVKANKASNIQFTFIPTRLSVESTLLAGGYDGICIFVNDTVSAPVADTLYAKGIRLIALRCAGYNNVDLKSVYQRIHVVRVPAYSPHAVAEHAVALMLSLNRKTHRAYFRTRDGNFTLQGLMGFDMYGKTAGIIGTGNIGRITADILKGFGMNVLVHDRFPNREWAQSRGIRYVELPELYSLSDIISLHCPLTPQTTYMINREAIYAMKSGVLLINTGRGKLIDTKALIEGLKTAKIGGAGLDVYEEESEYFFEDHSTTPISDDTLARLLSFPNIILTSHQGFFTREALDTIATTTLNNIQAFFQDKPLENEICYKCDSAVCRKKALGRCF